MMESRQPEEEGPGGRLRLLVFDLEGLLEDARSLRVRALADALTRLAWQQSLEIELPNGTTLELLSSRIEENLDLLAPDLTEENLALLLNLVQESKCRLVQQGQVRLHPQIPSALERLGQLGYDMAILSSDSRACMLALIDYYELHRYIDISVCRGDVGSADPTLGLQEIVENQEILQSEVLFISNRGTGLEIARRVGIASLGCLWGGASDEELQLADEVVQSPEELVELLFPAAE